MMAEPGPHETYLKNVDSRPTLEELKTDCEILDMVLALEREHTFLTLRDTDELLIYDTEQGIYTDKAESIAKSELQMYVPRINAHSINEVITKLRQRNYIDRSEFDANPEWLHADNGLVHIDTLEFKRHATELYSLQKIAAKYNPRAQCPNFVKFLKGTIEPEYIATVAKLLGYLLYKKSIYHKAFMFCGDGSNGKSTLINTIEAFLGKPNRATVSLQDITTNRFAKAELYGKSANLFADIPSEKIINTGDFKMLVSGDPIGAERKHQQRFSFENHAKLIFSANTIPKTDDESYAYYRRWVIIPFTRVFEGANADEYLLEKLTTEEELSGILNLALKGLKKLKQERGFNEVDLEDIKRQYDTGASRIRAFIEEKCIIEPSNQNLQIESSILREDYRKYCRQHGTRYFDERKFGEELQALGITHKQKQSNKRRVYYDFGIQLKNQVLNSLDKMTTIPSKYTDSNIIEEIVGVSPKDLSTKQEGGA